MNNRRNKTQWKTRSVDELKAHLDEMKAEFDGLKKAERKPDDAAVRKAAAYSKAFWEHMHTGMPENALREGSDGAGMVPGSGMSMRIS